MYIAIEGIGGAGKGVQIRMLADRLASMDVPLVIFREPGGTLAGEQLREMLLDKSLELNADAQLCMFAAARFQLMPVIAEAETKGQLVITDRCLATSYAYQGVAMKVGFLAVDQHHQGIRKPDLIIILDVDPAVAVSRRKTRNDRYTRDVEFMTEAKRGYGLFSRYVAPHHDIEVVTVDAAGIPEEVFERVWTFIQPKLS